VTHSLTGAWFQPLNLSSENLVSKFPYFFKCNLYRYAEELREMREPKRWPQVMNWSYGVMAPTYLVCMCLGYYAYGGAVIV
jgi:hypothetical protein